MFDLCLQELQEDLERGFLLEFSLVKTTLLGGSNWFSVNRWGGRLNLSSDQQMVDFQEILLFFVSWNLSRQKRLGKSSKIFWIFHSERLEFLASNYFPTCSFGVKDVSDFNLWERDFQQGLCCVFSRGKSCISNVWDRVCLQERFVCGMLILAEFSAGESNTLLFEHVQYVSYCMMAFRQKLRLL